MSKPVSALATKPSATPSHPKKNKTRPWLHFVIDPDTLSIVGVRPLGAPSSIDRSIDQSTPLCSPLNGSNAFQSSPRPAAAMRALLFTFHSPSSHLKLINSRPPTHAHCHRPSIDRSIDPSFDCFFGSTSDGSAQPETRPGGGGGGGRAGAAAAAAGKGLDRPAPPPHWQGSS